MDNERKCCRCLLPDAHARRINEALLQEGTADRWKQLWEQIKTSAGQLAQAGLAMHPNQHAATKPKGPL